MDASLPIHSLLEGVWLTVRVGGLWMTLPVFGSPVLSSRLRILLTLGLSIMLWSLLQPLSFMPEPGTAAWWLGLVRELAIGVLLGFILRIAFEAILMAAELISLAMGLGFAQLNDPLRGVSTPVLGQFFAVVVTLLFLSLEGHLRVLEWLLLSYQLDPLLQQQLVTNLVSETLSWSGQMFVQAVQLALPAMLILLIVNLGFGMISRSAPSLNLLAVGFPAALLLGLLVLVALVPLVVGRTQSGFESAFVLIADILS